MIGSISFFNNRQNEIERACHKYNVSPIILKRFWDISCKWDGEKDNE
jgi:hypothetical protein